MEILLWVAIVAVGTLLYLTARVAARIGAAVTTIVVGAAFAVYFGYMAIRRA